MTRTISAETGDTKTRVVTVSSPAVRHPLLGKLEKSLRVFLERNIGMVKADPQEERNNARRSFDFADLDVVVRRSGSRCNKQLGDPFITDGAQDPGSVPARTFLVGVFRTDDFDCVSAFSKIAESGFGDHIGRFFFQVDHHGPAFFKAAGSGVTDNAQSIRKYIIACKTYSC